jgi:hypothetical protein
VNDNGTEDLGDDVLLGGATFTVYLDNGDNVFNATTDTLVEGPDAAPSGILEYGNLEDGTYWVVEVVVPAGFVGSPPIRAIVDSDSSQFCVYDADGLIGCFQDEFPGTGAYVRNTPVKPTPTPTPGGGVSGETGTPRVTLPPTDTDLAQTAPSSDGWRTMLAFLAAVLATALVITPRRGFARRR